MMTIRVVIHLLNVYVSDEITFTVGFIRPIKEGGWGDPPPRVQGDETYHFIIQNDDFGEFAKMTPGKVDIEAEDFQDQRFFFSGFRKGYFINYLIEENPDIEWLQKVSLHSLDCLEIEQMIPLENNGDILSLDAPEELSEEFEIPVIVENLLPVSLDETILIIRITGAYEIINIGASYPEITSMSYYDRRIKEMYNAGEKIRI